MAETTEIAWCDSTFNPWIGCQKVSPGCDNCYAETLMDKRYHKVKWGPHGERKRTSEANWKQPLHWARRAAVAKAKAWANCEPAPERPRVFCSSLADWLDNQVPRQWRNELGTMICSTPELDWLLLTKRPENYKRLAPWNLDEIPSNVWIGFTAEDQEHYDRRWAIVRDIPARVRFCSYEPALGPLELSGSVHPDWIICGGESGAGYRDMPEEWADQIRYECGVAGVAFFMKQMAGKKPIPYRLQVREFPEVR